MTAENGSAAPLQSGAVVVFDTSTLVGACISRDGNPARALAWALARQVVAASVDTLAELKTVLTRPKLDKFRSPEMRMAFCQAYAGAVRLHRVTAATLQRSYQQIDYRERESIALGIEQGLGIRAIARMLNRCPSTISREIQRNAPGNSYGWRFAQQRCERRRRFGRAPVKLIPGNALFESIVELLHVRWSPQQIAAHLTKLHPADGAQRASL